MKDISLMLGIGVGNVNDYFSVFSHYDIDQEGQTDVQLRVTKDFLAVGDTFNHTFWINGVDRLTPTGWHHLPMNYVYSFEEIPGFWSTYGIAWNNDPAAGSRFIGYIDEKADGYDTGDNHDIYMEYNYDGGYLPIEVVEDNLLDVIAVQQVGNFLGNTNTLTGDELDLGNKIRNSNIVIQLTSREYVDYTQVKCFLETVARDPTPTDATDYPVAPYIQILENPISLDSARIEGVFENPANDRLGDVNEGVTNFVVFNVNLLDTDDQIEDGGVFPFNLTIEATNDDTNTRATYQTVVNIRIMPVDPILMIQDVSYGDINPGDPFDLRITLKNEGKDTAREIYVTLSNDWYEDDPFFLIDAFVSSISSYQDYYEDDLSDCDDCDYDQLTTIYTREYNLTSMADLGIDETSEVVDAERVLMSPAAKINRLYIEEIGPGQQATVIFKMRADTHMQEGKAYDEIVILEFRDSYGMRYDWTMGPKYTEDMAYVITLVTADNDKWPKTTEEEIEEKAAEQYAQAKMSMYAIIIILVVLLVILGLMYSRRRKDALEEAPEEEFIAPPAEEEEEMAEEEAVGPPGEEEEEEKAEDEDEDEWGAPEEEEEKVEEEEKADEDEDEWGAPEEEEEKVEEEEEEDWSSDSKEEEEEEEWS
jgi:hypothetical protein